MLHIPASWHFDMSIIYPQGFRGVNFFIILKYVIKQQYLWNIAIQLAVGCSAYELIYFVRVLTAREIIIVKQDYFIKRSTQSDEIRLCAC